MCALRKPVLSVLLSLVVSASLVHFQPSVSAATQGQGAAEGFKFAYDSGAPGSLVLRGQKPYLLPPCDSRFRFFHASSLFLIIAS